ncbi:type II toxin-antitoxin system RelE/ParE family toxin [uncultured Imperialibacter sp.]|uniref:type II toxin-antitoxin system RelE family toxin n=1 Tax=uncultured Imperialibacter sp. TaxID=1672639 RepID=UPI0030D7B9EB
MNVRFAKNFLKDLASVPSKERAKIEAFVFEEILTLDEISSINSIKKLKGYPSYYRIRFGNYRVGISYTNEILTFERVLHRKEIYRYFP